MRLKRLAAVLAGLTAATLAGPALAQSSLGIGNAEMAVQPSGSFFGLFTWIASAQREFFTALRHALVALRQGSGGMGWLIGLSFVYGIFHAAGPGHGKAVISSYMLANEVQLRRGIALSFVSALLQAVSALLLVGAGWYLLRRAAMSMTDAAFGLEVLSYALIAVFGAYLLYAKSRALWRRRVSAARTFSASTGQLAFNAPGIAQYGGGSIMRPASGGFEASVCRDPSGEACDCGRAHMPDPTRLGGKGALGLRAGASAVLAVGLRPCSGAIVVLTFSLMNGLYAAGVLSVLAMALGTAITVSVLASLAVFSKGLALRFGNAKTGWREAIEIAGALLLFLLGLALLGGAINL